MTADCPQSPGDDTDRTGRIIARICLLLLAALGVLGLFARNQTTAGMMGYRGRQVEPEPSPLPLAEPDRDVR